MLQSKRPAPDFEDLLDSLIFAPNHQRRAAPRGGHGSVVDMGLCIGYDDDGSITPIVTGAPAGDGVATCYKGSNTSLNLREWVLRAIGTETRGVLCAWPSAPGLKPLPSDRIMALDAHSNVGKSNWWMDRLKRTKFSRRDSYMALGTEASTTVYRVGGEPLLSWNWFPSGRNYNIDPGEIDAFLHFGLVVTVQRAAPEDANKSVDAQLAAVAIPTYLELDAAVVGLAPPVFASFPIYNDATNAITGSLTASQLHTFSLANMLEAQSALRPEDNAKLVVQQLRGASVEIAAKLRRLAEGKILKLNMTPHTVVFCPKLAIDEDGDGESWSLEGYGFKVGSRPELIAGKPHFSGFHSPLCKRMTTNPDTDSAFVFMTAILLESTYAEFGDYVARVMRDAMLESDAALVKAVESAQASLGTGIGSGGFVESARRLFPNTAWCAVNQVEDALSDFAQSLSTCDKPSTALLSEGSAQRPRFQLLIQSILETRTYQAPEFAPSKRVYAEYGDSADEHRLRDAIDRIVLARHAKSRL